MHLQSSSEEDNEAGKNSISTIFDVPYHLHTAYSSDLRVGCTIFEVLYDCTICLPCTKFHQTVCFLQNYTASNCRVPALL